jgi:hypothetical protein
MNDARWTKYKELYREDWADANWGHAASVEKESRTAVNRSLCGPQRRTGHGVCME